MLLLITLPALAAEKKFDFGETREGQTPTNFTSTVTGKGKPGQWHVLLDDDTPAFPPLSPQAQVVTKKPVLAQLSQDRTDDHYPLFIYQDDTYGDFTLTTRFKIVAGSSEQMAGVAFRIQDEKNYYYVRASALGNSFYFFKFVKGELIGPIGSKIEISTNTWHDMTVDCRGSQITCSLDGRAIIPQMQQDTFSRGKVGFWTKSDSVSYFSDAKIVYKPLGSPAQAIVRDLMKKHDRLLQLSIYVPDKEPGTTRLVASSDPATAKEGAKSESAVITKAETWYGKEKDSVSVVMPLRDRNGEPIAAVRVVMKSFKGQTEENAIIRATPIVRDVQSRVSSLDDLTL
jgi:hypothetical protein